MNLFSIFCSFIYLLLSHHYQLLLLRERMRLSLSSHRNTMKGENDSLSSHRNTTEGENEIVRR